MDNQYVANQNTTFVPSKILKVFPDAQGVDIKPSGRGTSQFIFQFADFLNFINPETLRLRFNLKFAGRGMPKPNPVAGTHSLFRHMRTQSLNSLAVLEEVDEYSSATAMMYSYSQDDGTIHNRELNEGLSLTNNSAEQLFWAPQNLPSATLNTANVPKSVAISLPVHSGLIGENASVLPVASLGGLKLTMETNTLMKSVKLANNSGKGEAKEGTLTAQVSAAAWTGNADLIVNLILTQVSSVESGFEVGDAVYYDLGGVDTIVGLVVYVNDGAGQTQIGVRGDVIATTGTGPLLIAGTKIYTKATDRFNGWTPTANMVGSGAVAELTLANSLAPVKIDYTISDLECIVEQIQPPQSYTNELVKKLNSREGLVMVYKNTTLQKVNLIGLNGVLSASIPNQSQKVYAVNVMPLNSTDTYNGNNLTAVGVDGAQNYQFIVNSTLVPDQRCPLRRMGLTPSYVEQLHLQEVRKSLIASGVFVKNLQNAEKNFIIGRGVGMYGAVSDITKSDLSVRIEYLGATRQKTLNCYVCSARTMVIRPNQVQVIM